MHELDQFCVRGLILLAQPAGDELRRQGLDDIPLDTAAFEQPLILGAIEVAAGVEEL